MNVTLSNSWPARVGVSAAVVNRFRPARRFAKLVRTQFMRKTLRTKCASRTRILTLPSCMINTSASPTATRRTSCSTRITPRAGWRTGWPIRPWSKRKYPQPDHNTQSAVLAASGSSVTYKRVSSAVYLSCTVRFVVADCTAVCLLCKTSQPQLLLRFAQAPHRVPSRFGCLASWAF